MIWEGSLLEKAWDWKRQYGSRIVDQLKKLGSSCDWERTVYHGRRMQQSGNRGIRPFI